MRGDRLDLAQDKVMDVFFTLLMGGILLPISLGFFFNANTVGWDTQTLLVWAIFPVMGVLAIAIGLIQGVRKGAFSR